MVNRELAMSLKANEAFNAILDDMKASALDQLVNTDAHSAEQILTSQTLVKVIDEFRLRLTLAGADDETSSAV